MAGALLLVAPAYAQEEDEGQPQPIALDPCAEHPCRELTREERAGFGRLLAKLIEAMPVPDRLRYEQSGLNSIQGLGQFLITDAVRQSSAFPANVVDSVGLAYSGGTFPRKLAIAALYVVKASERGVGIDQRFHRTETGEMEVFDVKVAIAGYATPLFAEGLATGRVLQSSGDVLVWEAKLPAEERKQGMALFSMVVGARTRDRAAMRGSGGAPGDALAPLRAIRVDVQGPASEARALLKQVDKRALKALLAPAKKRGAARAKGAK
ncbi:MAG: hypothetical protein ACOX6T_16025 [Myxococcales bacterium]